MKPSIVAMSGRIIPAPLAIPVTMAFPLDKFTFLEKALGTVSVVMIASAAESQSLLASSAFGSAATIRSDGSGSMMTPVENGRTCSGSQPTWPASASHTSRARLGPPPRAGVGIAGVDDQRAHLVANVFPAQDDRAAQTGSA